MSEQRSNLEDDTPLLTVGHYRRAVADMTSASDECEVIRSKLAKAEAVAGAAAQRVQELQKAFELLGITIPDETAAAGPVDESLSESLVSRATFNGAPTWTATVEDIVRSAPDEMIAYAALKTAIKGSALRTSISEQEGAFEKSFHRTLGNLEKRRKVIVRYREHAFTPDGYKKYCKDVAEGRREEVVEGSKGPRGSAMGDAICEYLRKMGRKVSGPDIVSYLKDEAGFDGTLRRGDTGAYNVLSRYVSRGVIQKDNDEKTYWLADAGQGHGTRPEGLFREAAE